MKFYEMNIDTGYEYTVEDVFGTMAITSAKKLINTDLDTIVMGIMQAGFSNGQIKEGLTFNWQKRSNWEEDEKPTAFRPEFTIRISNKSRAVAFILALFLGGFGAHRFYLGRKGTAIIQLLLTLTVFGALISGPWAFIDLLIISGGAWTDTEGRKVRAW